MHPLLRSIFSVIAGFVALSLVAGVVTSIAIHLMHVPTGQPTPQYLAINLAGSILAALIGGFVCGLVAPSLPIRHGAVLAGIMALMGILSWIRYQGQQPLWYQAVIVLGMPLCAVAGAALYHRTIPEHAR